MKGLAHKTEWVEFPDIEPTCLKLGAKHTQLKNDGSPLYTIPVIYDPNTKSVVSDSLVIVRYLEGQYPSSSGQEIIPAGTSGLVAAFRQVFSTAITPSMFALAVVHTNDVMNAASQEYFRRTREDEYFHKKLEEVAPKGATREAEWEVTKKGLDMLASWYDENEAGGSFICGERISFPDIMVAARVKWLKLVFGEDSEDWKVFSKLNGGRWVNILKEVERYENVF